MLLSAVNPIPAFRLPHPHIPPWLLLASSIFVSSLSRLGLPPPALPPCLPTPSFPFSSPTPTLPSRNPQTQYLRSFPSTALCCAPPPLPLPAWQSHLPTPDLSASALSSTPILARAGNPRPPLARSPLERLLGPACRGAALPRPPGSPLAHPPRLTAMLPSGAPHSPLPLRGPFFCLFPTGGPPYPARRTCGLWSRRTPCH